MFQSQIDTQFWEILMSQICQNTSSKMAVKVAVVIYIEPAQVPNLTRIKLILGADL